MDVVLASSSPARLRELRAAGLAPRLESIDGTGTALSWPLVRAACALLTEVEDTVEPMPPPAEPAETTPSDFDPRPVRG